MSATERIDSIVVIGHVALSKTCFGLENLWGYASCWLFIPRFSSIVSYVMRPRAALAEKISSSKIKEVAKYFNLAKNMICLAKAGGGWWFKSQDIERWITE